MFTMRIFDGQGRRAALVWVAIGLLGLGTARAQTPGDGSNYLDEVRRRNEVAAQKAEADVRLALRTAVRLAATDPAKAVERLKETVKQVENTTALSDGRRDSLKRMLQDRIRVLEATANREAARTDEAAAKQAATAERRAEQQQQATELEKVRRVLQELREMQRDGRGGDGDRPGSRPPNNQAVEAAKRIRSTTEQLEDNRQLRDERAGRRGGALRDVERSATLPKGDIEYPKDWRERTKARSKTTTQLTAKERAIFQALDSAIPAQFKDSPLDAVLDYIMAYTGLVIVVDKRALEEVGASYSSPITANLKGATVRTVLRKILSELGLTYVIKDEVIQVVTALQAKSMLVTKVYYIGDLLRPWFLVEDAARLIDLIQRTIEPASWQVNGGTGTIAFEPITLSLVIKQTAEFHGVLGGGLMSGLRP
jgi:hypothetical protein